MSGMRNKSALVCIGLLALLCAACSFNIGGNSNSNTSMNGSSESEKEAPATAPKEQAETAVPKVTSKKIDETLTKKKIIVEAEYPQISGVEAAEDFNRTIEAEVKKRIDRFKNELEDPLPEEMDRGIDIRFETSLVDSDIVSILLWDSENTGGAHPNTTSFVINYDLKGMREIPLNELFKAGSPFLKKIASYCRADLKKQLEKLDAGTDFLNDGTAPVKENYTSWVITEKGIKFTFDAYQVAAYVFGPQEVVVPYAELSDLLESNTPVSHLIDGN